MRYRSAAMAEFWRALKTLKALQAEPAAGADLALELRHPTCRAGAGARAAAPTGARRAHADRRGPNEPERLMAYRLPEPPIAGPALHEPAAASAPNEPERRLRSTDDMSAQPEAAAPCTSRAADAEPNPTGGRPTSERAAPMAAQRSTMPQ